jgi:hypothetical protein
VFKKVLLVGMKLVMIFPFWFSSSELNSPFLCNYVAIFIMINSN